MRATTSPRLLRIIAAPRRSPISRKAARHSATDPPPAVRRPAPPTNAQVVQHRPSHGSSRARNNPRLSSPSATAAAYRFAGGEHGGGAQYIARVAVAATDPESTCFSHCRPRSIAAQVPEPHTAGPVAGRSRTPPPHRPRQRRPVDSRAHAPAAPARLLVGPGQIGSARSQDPGQVAWRRCVTSRCHLPSAAPAAYSRIVSNRLKRGSPDRHPPATAQALVHQSGDPIQHTAPASSASPPTASAAVVCSHDEYTQPSKSLIIAVGGVAPGNRARRSLPHRQIPLATHEQPERLIEPLQDRRHTTGIDALAASSIASGRPSSREQIAAVVPPFRPWLAEIGTYGCARSTNRRTAGDAAIAVSSPPRFTLPLQFRRP